VFGLLFPILSILLLAHQQGLPLTLATLRWAHGQHPLLLVIDSAPFFLGLVAGLAGRRQETLVGLTRGLKSETRQLRASQDEVEKRTAAWSAEMETRARELERSVQANQQRAEQMEAAVRIALAISSILEPQELLDRVVRLIADHLGHYHVGIFLVDGTGRWAELCAANSEGGQRMLERNHRLRVGEQGIVGYATRTGRPRLALDVGADAIYFDNPDLPETRSEIALPLIARSQSVGALDLQSRQVNAFNEEEVAVLRIIADQVAIALDNARLFNASRDALRQAEATQQAYVRQGWRRHSSGQQVAVFGSRQSLERESLLRNARADRGLQSVTVVPNDPDQGMQLVAPIKIRNEVIGAMGLEKSDEDGAWSRDQVELVETVADQVAQALETARLFEEAQRRAERERLISQVGARLRSVDDVDGILRVAVQETRRALGVSHGAIRLGTETHLVPAAGGKGEQLE
jgi:GAF domain-containing protein